MTFEVGGNEAHPTEKGGILTELTSYQAACVIAGILDEKKTKDIVILDISRVSIMADYFVICSTDTSTQSKAVSEVLLYDIKHKFNRMPKGEQRDNSGKWVLLDYGDVILHILHKEAREYYALEKFWSHAFIVYQEQWLKEYEKVSQLIK